LNDEQPVILDGDLLAELEARWQRLGVALLEGLQPGVPVQDMDALAAPLGLRLPPEARTWWAWHDGVRRGVPPRMNGAGWSFLTLESALAETAFRRELAESVAGEHAQQLWATSWLVLSTNMHGAAIVIDAVDDNAPASPVRYIETEDSRSSVEPATRSMGEMVSWWLDAIDSGAHSYDARRQQWLKSWEQLDPFRRGTCIV
jgi:cell wall assembly regulator SMI1